MTTRKGVTYDSAGRVLSCIFCKIRDGTEPGTIVARNDKFFAFKTTGPVTHTHLLVSPVQHIRNYSALSGPKDADLLREMIEFGKMAMDSHADGALYCFHVPPFNSIDHLHLHCIANPEQMTWLAWLKYLPDSYWCLTAGSAVADLESRRQEPTDSQN